MCSLYPTYESELLNKYEFITQGKLNYTRKTCDKYDDLFLDSYLQANKQATCLTHIHRDIRIRKEMCD